MKWYDYIPKVIVPSLAHRQDRRNNIIGMLHHYGIEATIWDAVSSNDGAVGLMLTMRDIFNDCLCNNIKRVLILEDDCEMLVEPEEFYRTMNVCCNDLQNIDWQMFYLGLQHTLPFRDWTTPNILPVSMGFSTHAVLYSEHAMKFYLSSFIDEPIDNFWVKNYQQYNTSFCSYPMLCTQREGFSDIGKQRINWDMYIQNSFQKSISNILPLRFK